MNNFLWSCGVFYYILKKLFCNTWSSANFVITDVTFYVFPSSFLHSMEKISQFLIFLSISLYLWYFLLQLVFSEPNLYAQFLFSPGVLMESWGPCNLRKWRKFKIFIAPSWRKNFSLGLVTSFYHDQMKITISPRMFYNVWCFANCRF